MKIDINKIPQEGMLLQESLAASTLDLETGIVKFIRPVNVKANIYRITNAVTAELALSAPMHITCSRCLCGFEVVLSKNLRLSYPVSKTDLLIDLDPDIREEIILDYPIKPLCSADCKGLCPKCGQNLNQGLCCCKL
jgi:uncharacterized protein